MRWLLIRGLVIALATYCAAQSPHKTAPLSRHTKDICVHVQDESFHSVVLGREMKYRILLPCGYANGGRFPVFYLLHGLYGGYLDWDTLTNLERDANEYPMIIVMPDAGDSWYTNSATDANDKFEDYIANDLLTEIDNKFHTLRSGHHRAIAGLSMGGYGAIKIALRHPENFAFAGSLSGALTAPQDLADLKPDFRTQLMKVFGAAGSLTRANSNIFSMLEHSNIKNLPYFYLGCGASDDFLFMNRDFVAQLSAKKIQYEYHETPGGHGWDYWDRSVPDLLRAVAATLLPSIH